VFIDPLVAIGYDYQIGIGDPNFASVLLPSIGDNVYELQLWNGSAFEFADTLNGGDPYTFGLSGVDRFRILGIELGAGLDPFNPSAFITGLTFASDGSFSGTMTPITVNVPGPIAGAGLPGLVLAFGGALAWWRRRPRAVAA
jgi:hypothetical protein